MISKKAWARLCKKYSQSTALITLNSNMMKNSQVSCKGSIIIATCTLTNSIVVLDLSRETSFDHPDNIHV